MGKKKTNERELHSGEMVDGLDRPNNLVPLEPYDGLPRMRWPLLKLKLTDEENENPQGAFFDSRHGDHWWEWDDRAPTWMDPHVFAEMCSEHKRLQQCFKVCFDRNTERPALRDAPEMLDEVMEEYLEYVLDQFEQVKPLLVKWLVRNYASKETTPEKVAARRKKRSRSRQSGN